MAYNWKADLPSLEAKYQIPPGLLGALVRAESGGRPTVTSPAGAIGLTQLMPQTAKGLGVNPHDPRQNLEGGAKYLSQQLKAFRGNIPKALAAYNAGPGAVRQYGGIPPYKETQEYVKRLTGFWKESSRYGQSHTNRPVNARQNAAGSVTAGGTRPVVPVPVPTALPAPTRKQVLGLEERDLAAVGQVYSDDPLMAQAVVDRRQREQNQFDLKYERDATSYQANQAAIAQAQETNRSQLLGANKYKPGVVGQNQLVSHGQTQVAAPWNSKAKFVKTPNGWVKNWDGSEDRYRFLDRVGTRGFGLRHDGDGVGQTFGGRHDPDGFHPQRRAVDFGDAKNSRNALFSFAQWARQNASSIRELYYNPLGWGIKDGKVIQGLTQAGHDDHLHAAW